MILIADSGSTKCTWLLGDGTHTETVRTRGMNAIHDSPELIGIAALGTTPYVIRGLRTAREPGLLTESTRMKAGTAQKRMLNMRSTAVMIRLGLVEGNRMVNMQLTNDKLVARGTRMVMEASRLDERTAQELLLRHGSVKKALKHFNK